MKKLLATLFLATLGGIASAAAPVISSSNTTFTVGASGSFTLAASNTPLTGWTNTGASLPASLSLNTATGVISGTPAVGDVGTYNLLLTATNASGPSVAQAFTLTIRDVPRVVILKETITVTGKYLEFDRNLAATITSDPTDVFLGPDEIQADQFPYAGSNSYTSTSYYILDMVAQTYVAVGYYTSSGSGSGSGSSTPQKLYYVGPAEAPLLGGKFSGGLFDDIIPARAANTWNCVCGTLYQDPNNDPNNVSAYFDSYSGPALPFPVTKATATVPAWTIPIAPKSFTGTGYSYSRNVSTDPNYPNDEWHSSNFAVQSKSASLDSILTPLANTGGVLPVINPTTGLAVLPASFYDGSGAYPSFTSNTLKYGVRLVLNTLEKLKYSRSPYDTSNYP